MSPSSPSKAHWAHPWAGACIMEKEGQRCCWIHVERAAIAGDPRDEGAAAAGSRWGSSPRRHPIVSLRAVGRPRPTMHNSSCPACSTPQRRAPCGLPECYSARRPVVPHCTRPAKGGEVAARMGGKGRGPPRWKGRGGGRQDGRGPPWWEGRGGRTSGGEGAPCSCMRGALRERGEDVRLSGWGENVKWTLRHVYIHRAIYRVKKSRHGLFGL